MTTRSLKELLSVGASSTPFAPVAAGDYELYAKEAEARIAQPFVARYGPQAGEEMPGHPSVNVQFEIVGEEGQPSVGRVLFHNFRINFGQESAIGFAKGAYKRLVGQDMDTALEKLADPVTEEEFAALMAADIVGGRIVASVKQRKQMRDGEATGEIENYISRWKD